jgi:hypothetical protein
MLKNLTLWLITAIIKPLITLYVFSALGCDAYYLDVGVVYHFCMIATPSPLLGSRNGLFGKRFNNI